MEVCPLNYIAEINAFYNWVICNPLPPDAQALWHVLMQLNNRCAIKVNDEWYWRVEFSIPNSTLTSILAFSRQQLDRMRNVLIQTGRIVYKKGKGNQSGRYRMIPVEAKYVTQSVTQSDTQTDTQVWSQSVQLCNIFGTLINSNSNYNNQLFCNDDDNGAREENAGEPKSPEQLFREYFGRSPTKAEKETSGSFTSRFGGELVEYAFFRACTTDNKNLAYVSGILQKLRERGIHDMAGLAADHISHQSGR